MCHWINSVLYRHTYKMKSHSNQYSCPGIRVPYHIKKESRTINQSWLGYRLLQLHQATIGKRHFIHSLTNHGKMTVWLSQTYQPPTYTTLGIMNLEGLASSKPHVRPHGIFRCRFFFFFFIPFKFSRIWRLEGVNPLWFTEGTMRQKKIWIEVSLKCSSPSDSLISSSSPTLIYKTGFGILWKEGWI